MTVWMVTHHGLSAEPAGDGPQFIEGKRPSIVVTGPIKV